MTTNKKFAIKLLTTLAMLQFVSCQRQTGGIERTLVLAGKNRIELEKVIAYYRDIRPDSLKLKAAEFLISNMFTHYSFKSDFYNAYATAHHTLDPQVKLKHADSLIRLYRNDFAFRVYDCQIIKSSFLIDNIELSFKVWKDQTWGSNITFETFCQYILPYRVGTEPLSDWRRKAYQEYNGALDSVRTKKGSAMDAAWVINNKIKKKGFQINSNTEQIPNIGYDGLSENFFGYCRDATEYTVYVMRALGIPAGQDFVKQWANRSSKHIWNFIIDGNGKTVAFDGAYTNLDAKYIHTANSKKGKVYRITFGYNIDTELESLKEPIPIFFKDPMIKDVSNDYWLETQVTVTAKGQSDIAYLSVFDNREWVPIQWSKVKKGNYLFKGMETDVVYLPSSYLDNKISSIEYPFILQSNGEKKILRPSTIKENILIHRKYDINKDVGFFKNMIGARFQGADKADFSDAVELCNVTHLSFKLYETLTPKTNRKFRFIRFLSAKGGYSSLAEFMLYSKERMLNGKILGSHCCVRHNKDHSAYMAFDGNTITYQDSCEPDTAWAGLDLGKPEYISKIEYACRNDDNYINPDHLYELFYHNATGWTSMGKKWGDINGIIYKNVPKNALLLIHDHSGGTEERIFTYENGKQTWW